MVLFRDSRRRVRERGASTVSLDIYVLAADRSRAVVDRFRARWLAGFEPSAEEYEFPQYATRPVAVYASPCDVIDRLLVEHTEPYGLYWHRPGGGADGTAMLFFTADGGLVAGVTAGEDDARKALVELADTVGSRDGYVSVGTPPPDTTGEFIAQARAADVHL
jgi:hypothetical protein